MPIGHVSQGMAGALAGYLKDERGRRRKAEDEHLDLQMEMIKQLANRPDANPALLGQALHDMLELGSGKVQRKQAPGSAGFLGSSELPMSQFLAGIQSGSTPIVGRTTEPVPKPPSPMEQGLMPEAATILPGPQPVEMEGLPPSEFSGAAVLGAPVTIPPEPIKAPPEATGMLSAARQVQQYNDGPKVLPVKKQPLLRAPEEMAEEAGRSAGIMETSRARGKMQGQREILTELGASPEQIRDAFITDIMGRPLRPRIDTTPQIYTISNGQGGQTFLEGYVVESPGDPMGFKVVDRLGHSLPPEAQPARLGSQGATPGAGTYTLQDAVDAWAQEKGRQPNYTEALKIRKDWEAQNDTLRPQRLQITVGNSDMTQQMSTAFRAVVARRTANSLIKSKDQLAPIVPVVAQVRADPSRGVNQLNLIYSYITALDRDSAVREGELALVRSIDSLKGNIQNALARLTNRQLVSPGMILEIANATDALIRNVTASAQVKEREFASEARVSGVGAQWDDYIRGFSGTAPATPGAAPAGAGGKKSLGTFKK